MSSFGTDPFRSDPFADPENPFAAPCVMDTAVETSTAQPLADRGARFVGALIDTIILLPLSIGVVAIFTLLRLQGSPPGARTVFLETDFLTSMVAVIAVSVFHRAINGYLLAYRGQTVGKLVMGTRIVDARTGEIPPLIPLFLKRFLLLQVLGVLPYVGWLIGLCNALRIFRENRRCLHDDLAGTQVIKEVRPI